MKTRLLFPLMMLVLAGLAPAAEPLKHHPPFFDDQGRFTFEVEVPAGSRHAVLESMIVGPPTSWRPLVSGPIDGRAARVTFRLPPAYSPREIVRAKAGTETTVPAAELNDPSLCTVNYQTVIDEKLKLDFLKDASGKMREWAALPRAEQQPKLIAWAQGNPLVAEAVVSMPADNVSIRFTDGDICVLLNKKRGTEELSPAQAPAGTYDAPSTSLRGTTPPAARQAVPKGSIAPLAATGLALPGSKRAITANSLESIFPNSGPMIAAWLTDAGYEVDEFADTSVTDIKGWAPAGSPLGVLFWHVHGCTFKKADGTETVGLVTRQFASEALSKGAFKDMRDSGELSLAIDAGNTVPFYTITSGFIRKYMRFAPNSLVVLDACFGANADLADAFIASGAGSFASWDWESGKQSGTPCRKIFDRMLGANQEAPFSTIKERSFSQIITETWMWQKKYDFDPSPKYPGQTRPNATLIWKHHPQTPAHILKPTILRILNQGGGPGQPYTILWLEGDFGDDPGEGKRNVTWGGQLQQVVKWEGQSRIFIRMPNPAPVGEVQVTVNRGFNSLSNAVPITQWTVPFKYQYKDAGTLQENMELNVKFRADLRGERIYPEEAVKYQKTNFWCIADCTGTLSASGTYSPAEGVTLSYSGGSTMKSYDLRNDQVPSGHLIVNSGEMRGDGTFSAFHLSAGGEYKAKYTYVLEDGTTMSQTVDAVSSFEGSEFFVPMPGFNPTTFVLRQGNKTLPWGSGSATLSWPATSAAAIPTAETPR